MQFDFSPVDWSDDDASPFDLCEYSESSWGSDPVSLTSCSSSSSSIMRTPTIRFAQEDEVFDHLHLNDYTEEDINATWFRPDEFLQMREEAQQEIYRMDRQESPCPEDETDSVTVRGLEFRTNEGSLKRSIHKREAYAAVMEEQQRQWQLRVENPERIAHAYQVVSSKCQGMALLKGIQDQHDIRDYVLPVTGSNKTNTTSLSTPESTLPCKPYEVEIGCRRMAVLEDIKILSVGSELALWHTNGAAA